MPIEIIDLKDLCLKEKNLLAYMLSFFIKERKFYASNRFIAHIIGSKSVTVSKTIKNLYLKGYTVESSYIDRKRHIEPAEKIKNIIEKIKKRKADSKKS